MSSTSALAERKPLGAACDGVRALAESESQRDRDRAYWHSYLAGPPVQRENNLDAEDKPSWALLHEDAVHFWEELSGAPARTERS